VKTKHINKKKYQLEDSFMRGAVGRKASFENHETFACQLCFGLEYFIMECNTPMPMTPGSAILAGLTIMAARRTGGYV